MKVSQFPQNASKQQNQDFLKSLKQKYTALGSYASQKPSRVQVKNLKQLSRHVNEDYESTQRKSQSPLQERIINIMNYQSSNPTKVAQVPKVSLQKSQSKVSLGKSQAKPSAQKTQNIGKTSQAIGAKYQHSSRRGSSQNIVDHGKITHNHRNKQKSQLNLKAINQTQDYIHSSPIKKLEDSSRVPQTYKYEGKGRDILQKAHRERIFFAQSERQKSAQTMASIEDILSTIRKALQQ